MSCSSGGLLSWRSGELLARPGVLAGCLGRVSWPGVLVLAGCHRPPAGGRVSPKKRFGAERALLRRGARSLPSSLSSSLFLPLPLPLPLALPRSRSRSRSRPLRRNDGRYFAGWPSRLRGSRLSSIGRYLGGAVAARRVGCGASRRGAPGALRARADRKAARARIGHALSAERGGAGEGARAPFSGLVSGMVDGLGPGGWIEGRGFSSGEKGLERRRRGRKQPERMGGIGAPPCW